MNKRVFSYILVLALLFVLSVPAFADDGAESVLASVPVRVTLEGPVLDSVDTFVVELAAQTKNAPLPKGGEGGIYRMEIIGEGSSTLDLEFSHTGVYTYTIYEVTGDNKDCTYDTTVYTLTVYVTMDEEWTLGATTVLTGTDAEKLDTASFVNVYSKPEPAKFDPPVEKIVSAKHGTPPKDSVFTFAMIPNQKDAPMPENASATTDTVTGTLYMDQKGHGSYEFGWMYFDENDVGNTYTYTIREIPGKDSRYTYDSEIYTLTITVSAQNRKIILDVTYTDRDGMAAGSPVFRNVFDAGTFGPKTGDETYLAGWYLLFAIGVIGLSTVIIIKKRKQE